MNTKKTQIKWTEENKLILKEHYPTGGTSQVMLMIPNSSKDSIKSAAKEFGISFNKEFFCIIWVAKYYNVTTCWFFEFIANLVYYQIISV